MVCQTNVLHRLRLTKSLLCKIAPKSPPAQSVKLGQVVLDVHRGGLGVLPVSLTLQRCKCVFSGHLSRKGGERQLA